MTNFGWWSSLAPPGSFMCQICFCSCLVEDAWQDTAGDKWDICIECRRMEVASLWARDVAEIDIIEMSEAQSELVLWSGSMDCPDATPCKCGHDQLGPAWHSNTCYAYGRAWAKFAERRNEEAFELLDEVKDLEADLAQAKIQVEFYRDALDGVQTMLRHQTSKLAHMHRAYEMSEDDVRTLEAENDSLRKQLAEWRAKRTLGGPPKVYTPDWSPNDPPDDRDPECVRAWPECHNGGYSPNCCRFPKSCSC